MMDIGVAAALAVGGYLVGAIPFGYLVARWRGVDIFQAGSGNIGATNVGRILGRKYGILVFLADFAKGAGPTAVAMALGQWQEPLYGVVAGLAAFLGHLFPVYLGFRGGKGVATGAGMVFVLLPVPAAIALVAWLIVVAQTRTVSLASLAAGVVLCLARVLTTPTPFESPALILTVFALIAVALVFVKHVGNIRRLLSGTENRLPESPAMLTFTKTLHVLFLGTWFGMALFFSFPVALSLFGSFEKEAEQTTRPSWFPVNPRYQLEPGMLKDQGTRAAGFAISPIFDHYFLWQGVCGLIAVTTALGWPKREPARRVHRWRVLLLILAFTTVVLGWPIEREVASLRVQRNDASDKLMERLEAAKTTPGEAATAAVATARDESAGVRRDFATWHLWSLLLNMVTILLVGVSLALAAHLPERLRPSAP